MTEIGSNNCMSTNTGTISGADNRESANALINDLEASSSTMESQVENMSGGENSDGHVVDIDKWADSLAKMLEDVPQYTHIRGHAGRIGRIPENLREVDLKAYEPCFLSVGPYHHGHSRVLYMERRKHIVLKCVLEQKPEITLKDYLMVIKSVEPQARSFYLDVNMDTEKFIHMLLLDSLYIVIVFCGMGGNRGRTVHTNTRSNSRSTSSMDNEENRMEQNEGTTDEDNSENTQAVTRLGESNIQTNNGQTDAGQPTWFWILLCHDLFLLENQLPFFVLQKMYNLIHFGSEMQLIVTMKEAFVRLLSVYNTLDSEMVISPIEEVHHLLHLCHMFFRPTIQQESTICPLLESSQTFRLGSALQLYEEGVIFVVRSSSTKHSLLDITFSSSGKLVMPCLHVEDNTISLLRNLIALEQMKYPSLGLNVSAYAVLLLHLVTTPDDVKLLRKKGIIQHHLSSDKEMMYMVNRLSVGLSFDYAEDRYSLKPVFRELKRFSERRTPRWGAWFKHRYFRNPWTVISLLAAAFLLFLTAVQTYYTVYSYYRPWVDDHP